MGRIHPRKMARVKNTAVSHRAEVKNTRFFYRFVQNLKKKPSLLALIELLNLPPHMCVSSELCLYLIF